MVTYEHGAIVRYAHPAPGEDALTFVLLEDNGDRVVIASLDFPEWRFPPQEIVAKEDIERVA